MNTFSYRKMLIKGIKGFIVILLSLLATGLKYDYPTIWGFVIGSSTLGGFILMGLNWLKVRRNWKLP